jgi:hypothetical protein
VILSQISREIPKNSIAAYRPGAVRFLNRTTTAHNGPDDAGARQQKEVSAVTNTIVSIQHADLGMPVSARPRMASLRALPITGDVWAAAGQKCVFGTESVVTGDTAVFAGATASLLPGTSTWSPPN